MKTYVNKITGIADSMTAILMSKRSWTREKEERIREDERAFICGDGGVIPEDSTWPAETKERYASFITGMAKAIEIGKKHTAILRYVDVSVTVEALHRGAGDDLDAHVYRMSNRMIRSSTRLSKFGNEKSDYYKDKILTFSDMCAMQNFPPQITNNGLEYVLTDNGYVLKGCENDNDVLRGTYPMSIPVNCVFCVNFVDLDHIIKVRDKNSNAHPELRLAIESIKEQIQGKNSYLYSALYNIKH